MSSICNLWLTPAQWAPHTSLALWWRRWWKCSPALGSTLGLADWGLQDEEEEGERSNRARETGRRKVGTGGGRCWSNGAQGRRGEGREKVSWASAPPSHASCARFWKQQLSCPKEWWRVQMLAHLRKLSRFRCPAWPKNFNVGNSEKKKIHFSWGSLQPLVNLTSFKPVNPDFKAGLNHTAWDNRTSQHGAKEKHKLERVSAWGRRLPVYCGWSKTSSKQNYKKLSAKYVAQSCFSLLA